MRRYVEDTRKTEMNKMKLFSPDLTVDVNRGHIRIVNPLTFTQISGSVHMEKLLLQVFLVSGFSLVPRKTILIFKS